MVDAARAGAGAVPQRAPQRRLQVQDETAPLSLSEEQLQVMLTKAAEAAISQLGADGGGSMNTGSNKRGRGRMSTSAASSKAQDMGVPDSADGRVYTSSLKLSIARCAEIISASHLPLPPLAIVLTSKAINHAQGDEEVRALHRVAGCFECTRAEDVEREGQRL